MTTIAYIHNNITNNNAQSMKVKVLPYTLVRRGVLLEGTLILSHRLTR